MTNSLTTVENAAEIIQIKSKCDFLSDDNRRNVEMRSVKTHPLPPLSPSPENGVRETQNEGKDPFSRCNRFAFAFSMYVKVCIFRAGNDRVLQLQGCSYTHLTEQI